MTNKPIKRLVCLLCRQPYDRVTGKTRDEDASDIPPQLKTYGICRACTPPRLKDDLNDDLNNG